LIAFLGFLSFFIVIFAIYFPIVYDFVIITKMDYSFSLPNERKTSDPRGGHIYEEAENSEHEFSDED